MNADLEKLITLQQLDTVAADAQRKLADEPARARQMEARLDASRDRVTVAKDRLSANQQARREVEKEVAVHQGRLSKFRDQLMSVKTNIEYQAMQKEMSHAQGEVKKHEDRILELMLEADELSAVLKEAETALAAEQKAVEKERKQLAAELADVKTSVERITADRGALIAQLNPQVVSTFELVAKRRNGVAVAEARDGICTICHVRLRPQVFNTVRRNEEIMQCDSCQRILYFVPAPQPAAESAAQPAQGA